MSTTTSAKPKSEAFNTPRSNIPRSTTPTGGVKNMIQSRLISSPRFGTEGVVRDDGLVAKTEKSRIHADPSNSGDPQSGRSRISGLPLSTTTRHRYPSKNSVTSNLSKLKIPTSPASSTVQKRQLENQFSAKRNRYVTMKKDIIDKQRQAVELFEDISELREKMIAYGSKDPGKVEKIVVIHARNGVEDRKPGKAVAGEYLETPKSVVDTEFIGSLERKLRDVPTECLSICQEALAKRTEIIGWLTDFSHEQEERRLDPEIAKQLEVYRDEGTELEDRLREAAKRQEEMFAELLRNITLLWDEHESYRNHMRETESSNEGLISDLNDKLEQTTTELNEEREKSSQLKERKTEAESQLQKSRMRLKDVETHSKFEATKVQQLQATVKVLESQLKQKEMTLDAKSKEMLRSIKNSENVAGKAEKQRDSLESRVMELQKMLDSREAEMQQSLAKLQQQLEETTSQLNSETESRQRADTELTEVRDRCEKLEQKSQQLCDLAEKTRELVVPPDGKHTENEVQLWNELQSTRKLLSEKEDQLSQLQQQKNEIISLMQQTAGEVKSASTKEKLAADLVSKTEAIHLLTVENGQLRKSLQIALEKSNAVERQLTELQKRLHAQSQESGKAGWGAHTIELQQQVLDLRTAVADLKRRNEELETGFIQKQLELEQRDLVMKEQSKVLKVRDELIELLKHTSSKSDEHTDDENEAKTSEQLNIDPDVLDRLVNKQIAAKAEDLQVLYSTLEKKQIQLMRLERVVQQMEDDNDRSQATRTKLEKEVAQLRLQLHEQNRQHRTTGFGFM